MSIYQKLAEIQDELFVPKGQYNDYSHFNYRSCEDILKAVKPICKNKGCVLTITNEIVKIDVRYYVEARVTLTDLETGESLTNKAQAREDENKKGMDGSQITGASSSYARKYALAGLFCIDNETDTDNSDYPRESAETPKKECDPAYLPNKDNVVTPEQWKKLSDEMNRTGITKEVILSMFSGVTEIKQLNQGQVIALLNKFAKTKDKQ